MGYHFVNLLSQEHSVLSHCATTSERVTGFLAVMLQWDAMVKKECNVHLWKQECFDSLLYEFEHCVKN